MKRIMENKIMKLIIAIAILFSMLISYVTPLTLATGEQGQNGQSGDGEYVKIVTTDLESEVAGNKDITLNVSTEYTRIQTGFKNVSLIVKSLDEDGTPTAQITSNNSNVINGPNYIEIKYGNVATGTQNLEDLVINFPVNAQNESYTKSVLVKIVGQYKNPQTGELDSIQAEKIITVKVNTVINMVVPKLGLSEYDFSFGEAGRILKDANKISDYPLTTLNAEHKSYLENYPGLGFDITPEMTSKVKGKYKYVSYGAGASRAWNYSETVIKRLNVSLRNGKNMSELKVIITIPYANYRTAMIMDLSEFINDGFVLDDINGDETEDSNGKNYYTGISGVSTQANEYAFTVKEGEEGDIVFTLVKSAASANLADAFDVDKTYSAYLTNYTGLEYTVAEFENLTGRENETYNVIAKVEASGYDYVKSYDEVNDVINVTRTESFDSDVDYDYSHGVYIIDSSATYALDYYIDENPTGHGVNTSRIAEYEQEGINFSLAMNRYVSEYAIDTSILDYRIIYTSDEGETIILPIDEEIIKLNSISGINGITVIDDEDIIVPEQGENIVYPEDGNPYIVFRGAGHNTIIFNYNLSYEKLIEAGLSQTEIANMHVQYKRTGMHSNSASGLWREIFRTWNDEEKLSYMEVNASDYNSDYKDDYQVWKEKSFEINIEAPGRPDYVNYSENPTFYIKLSEDFEYKDVTATILTPNPMASKVNSNLRIVGTPTYKYYNDKLYLVVETEGVYNSILNNNVQLKIELKKRLINPTIENLQELQVYMITDNKKYYAVTENEDYLEKNGEIQPNIFLGTASFNITGQSSVEAQTLIQKRVGRINKTYKSILDNETDDISEKNNPLVLIGGDTITLKGSLLNNHTEGISNVELMFRLPVASNKNVTGTTDILANDYVLPDAYIDEHPNLINVQKNTAVNHVNLTDFSNLVVKTSQGTLESTDYVLYYSETDGSDFDVTDTTVYTQCADISLLPATAKTIIVKLNNDLASNSYVDLSFQATMPTTATEYGMTGTMFGAQYIYNGTETATLDSEAAYVIKGKRAEVNIQKTFEGFGVTQQGETIKPTWISSLVGVASFKLKSEYGTSYIKDKYDNDEDGNTTEDLLVTTDANGIAYIKELDDGLYEIEEINSIEGYEGLSELYQIDVDAGRVVNVIVENKMGRYPLTIQKSWNGTNEILSNVTFKVSRTSSDGVDFDPVEVTTDETGVAVAYVPYGEYTIEEVSGTFGWYADAVENVIMNSPSKTVSIANDIALGNIVIKKSVQSSDTVLGLKFEVKSDNPFTYTDTSNNEVSIGVNKIIEVKEENDNVTIPGDTIHGMEIASYKTEIAADRESVTITIQNVPLGLYNVTEVDIPTLTGTDIERYEVARGIVNVYANGEDSEVYLTNLWKMGRLAISKKAVDKVWDSDRNEYVEIPMDNIEGFDYSQFAFRVQGQSYYGTAVDRTVYLGKNGKAAISLEIGKYTVTEIDNDSYKPYYSRAENSGYDETPLEYEVESKSLTTAYVKNELQYGYVKVTKTVEGKSTKIVNIGGVDTEVSAAYGITFYVQGRTPKDEYLTKEQGKIVIGADGTGISGPIPAGGEYVLTEDEETVPKYFVPAEQKNIRITKANDIDHPVEVTLDNKRGKGNLEAKTETIPASETVYPVIYKYVELETDENGKAQKGLDGKYKQIANTEKTLEGDIKGDAFAPNIPAGLYMVWQESVPTGWEKDLPQIVEVPIDGTEKAIFQITRTEEFEKNKLTVTKEVYKEVEVPSADPGEPAQKQNVRLNAQDYTQYELSPDESFEIKLTNVQTLEKYYIFVKDSGMSSITNLTPGKYEIEEREKIKYELIGLYNTDQSLTELTKENGKYVITVPNTDGAQLSLIVRNKINPDTGFGGSSFVDNYAKTTPEAVEEAVVTKTVVYMVDENGDNLPGVKFKVVKRVYNEQTGEYDELTIQLAGAETEVTTTENRIVLKGLDEGDYRVKVTSVPNGYVVPEDEEFTVYKDAARVVRMEVKAVVDRGLLTLRTYYTNEKGDQVDTASSKYKILDTATGKFVTFTRKLDGTYIKSNLPNAIDTISLRNGPMTVEGLETGNYDIGLVGVSEPYGIVKDTVENVDIVKNQEKTVSVEVEEKQIIDIAGEYYYGYLLDSDGNLWEVSYQNLPICRTTTIGDEYYGVKFKKIVSPTNNSSHEVYGIDVQGRVWYKGNCLGDEETETMYGKNIVDFDAGDSYSGFIAIDEDGKVYVGGYSGYNLGTGSYADSSQVYCLNDIPTNPLHTYNVNAVKCSSTNYMFAILDSEGRIWTWFGNYDAAGYEYEENADEYYLPKCLNLIPNHPFAIAYNNGVNFVDIEGGYYSYVAIDSTGKIWTWGENGYGQLGDGTSNNAKTPICISDRMSSLAGVKFVKGIEGYERAGAIDEQGRVWTWGYNGNAVLGTYNGYGAYRMPPMCISDEPTEGLYGTKIKKVILTDYVGLALDENNNVWSWGNSSYHVGANAENYSLYWQGDAYNVRPSKAEYYVTYNKHFDYNLEIVKADSLGDGNYYAKVFIDKNGRVWVMGPTNYYVGMGTTGYGTATKPVLVNIPGDPTFIDVATTKYNTVLLDDQGRVWTTGSSSSGVLGTGTTNGNDSTSYVCISELTHNSLYGVKIEKIYADGNNNGILAIDSEGKVWTWGTDRNSSSTKPYCESDNNANLQALYNDGIKIVSGDILNNCIILLDELGRVYASRVSFSYPGDMGCITTMGSTFNKLKDAYERGVRATEVRLINYNSSNNNTAHAVLIDSEGKLWIIADANHSPTGNAIMNGYFQCVSDMEGNAFKTLADNNIKLVKLDASRDNIYVVDSEGKLWAFGYNINTPFGVTSNTVTCISNYEQSKIYGKTIKNVFAGSGTDVFIVDENGDFYYNNDNLFSSIKNDLYRVNVTDLEGQYVIDNQDRVWTLGSKASVVGSVETREHTEAELLARVTAINPNATIEYFYDYNNGDYSSSRISHSIGLDSDGKVWVSGYLQDMEQYTGTAANESLEEFTVLEYFVNNNIQIVEIVNDCTTYRGRGFILLGSDGNIYHLGSIEYNMNFTFGSGVQIADVRSIFDTVQINLYKATNGSIYIQGSYGYTYGRYGVGTTYPVYTPTEIQFNEPVDIDLNDISYDEEHMYFLDSNKNLWITGKNDAYDCGDRTNSNRTTPFKIVTYNNQAISIKQFANNYNSMFVLAEDGTVYGSGYGKSYRCLYGNISGNNGFYVATYNDGTNDTTYIHSGKFKEIRTFGDYVIGIDTDNYIVEWGNDDYLGQNTIACGGNPAHVGTKGRVVKNATNTQCKYFDDNVIQTQAGEIFGAWIGSDYNSLLTTTNKTIAETYYNDTYSSRGTLIKYTDGSVEFYDNYGNQSTIIDTLSTNCQEFGQLSSEEIAQVLKNRCYVSNNGDLYIWSIDFEGDYISDNDIVCVNEKQGSILYGKTFIDAYYYNGLRIIDSNNNLYVIGYDSDIGLALLDRGNNNYYPTEITAIDNLQDPKLEHGWYIVQRKMGI